MVFWPIWTYGTISGNSRSNTLFSYEIRKQDRHSLCTNLDLKKLFQELAMCMYRYLTFLLELFMYKFVMRSSVPGVPFFMTLCVYDQECFNKEIVKGKKEFPLLWSHSKLPLHHYWPYLWKCKCTFMWFCVTLELGPKFLVWVFLLKISAHCY